MRLFEVEDRFTNDLETLLRNLVGRSDSERSSQTLSYPALSNLLNNMGYGGINYDTFKSIYDDSPSLQPLIANFDEDKIVLGTKTEAEPEPTQGLSTPKGPSVDTMAKSASKDYQKSLS